MVGSEIAVPILISFGLSAALGPLVIPLLRRMKVGQTVRDDGPGTHLKKTGTPTMGGILIMLSVTVTSLLYVRDYPAIIPVMVLTLGFGLIGFWTIISRWCYGVPWVFPPGRKCCCSFW